MVLGVFSGASWSPVLAGFIPCSVITKGSGKRRNQLQTFRTSTGNDCDVAAELGATLSWQTEDYRTVPA